MNTYRFLLIPIQTLKNGTLFTIYRNNTRLIFARFVHNQITGNDQSFFIGRCHCFTCTQGR